MLSILCMINFSLIIWPYGEKLWKPFDFWKCMWSLTTKLSLHACLHIYVLTTLTFINGKIPTVWKATLFILLIKVQIQMKRISFV